MIIRRRITILPIFGREMLIRIDGFSPLMMSLKCQRNIALVG
jgi:hypothetical protein